MNFEIFWDPKAVSQLRKLPKNISSRVVKKIRLAGETGIGLELLNEHEFGFKIRIGDYRALCDVYYNPDKIVVRIVEHRKKVYKK
ncbi:MAG: type II toxin-antitoxin system RelE/ParE family toxin [Candidatus Methanoperedens sp.]|nr:type II toxin-antitoxin system RelE/ParE family toxin [Candidatus Methanoperedens sp.]